jgi:hypothetical protein
VSLDRMHRGRRVRVRISASASLSMVRAEAELNVPLHGACGGAPCLSMLISMASDPWPWCLPRAMRLPRAGVDASPRLRLARFHEDEADEDGVEAWTRPLGSGLPETSDVRPDSGRA